MKKTVEFRQHHGTLDAKDICEWVYFVTSLARAAERKDKQPAAAATAAAASIQLPESLEEKIRGLTKLDEEDRENVRKEAMKYRDLFQEGKRKRTLEDLFDLLELPVEKRKYWWARAKKMKELAKEGGYLERSTCEYPCDCNPPCSCNPCNGVAPCNCKPPCHGAKDPCSLLQIRDCEEWEMDELVIPTYGDDDESEKSAAAAPPTGLPSLGAAHPRPQESEDTDSDSTDMSMSEDDKPKVVPRGTKRGFDDVDDDDDDVPRPRTRARTQAWARARAARLASELEDA